jgi:hypothetical protein
MSAQLSNTALAEVMTTEGVVPRSVAGVGDQPADDDQQMASARGTIVAVLIALPCWALIGFTVYMLL